MTVTMENKVPDGTSQNADTKKVNNDINEQSFKFSSLNENDTCTKKTDIEFILDIPLEITVELGRTTMLINDLLQLGQGAVIELNKVAGLTLEVLANQKLIARGEVVVVNDKYGLRLTEIVTPIERIERLK